jgi:hypothetical protein
LTRLIKIDVGGGNPVKNPFRKRKPIDATPDVESMTRQIINNYRIGKFSIILLFVGILLLALGFYSVFSHQLIMDSKLFVMTISCGAGIILFAGLFWLMELTRISRMQSDMNMILREMIVGAVKVSDSKSDLRNTLRDVLKIYSELHPSMNTLDQSAEVNK